ncbi:MAG: polyprenyl synthetase family protein [Deltaproteobacteria bacterium]
MELSEIIEIIAPDLAEVENHLTGNIESPVPLVHEICRYILGSGGKRVRPAVVLLASGAMGLTGGRERIASSVSLELIHTATLLHDDVVDDAQIRRGRVASNLVWGSKPSVLVGDFMLARALWLISSCGSLEVIKAVTDASAKLAEGQVFEVMVANNMLEISERLCFDIIENKTASLIEACAKVGAILARADERSVSALGEYGFNLGAAFQIVDDALDYSADQGEFGKTIGQDLKEGKLTLPLVYALEGASNEERVKTLALLGKDAPEEDVQFILAVVQRYRGVDRTLRRAEGFIEKAKSAIAAIPESGYRESLASLADYVLIRRK